MDWILILIMQVGAVDSGKGNSITTSNFRTEKSCQEAGKAVTKLSLRSTNEIIYLCVKNE